MRVFIVDVAKVFVIFIIFISIASFTNTSPIDETKKSSVAFSRLKPNGYFQYVNVPALKEYEFGWNRGNSKHFTSRFEQNKQHKFRTRARWGDKKDGYGEHYWEYNHSPKSYEEPDYKPVEHKPVEYKSEPEPAYKPEPAFKPSKTPVYVPSYNS